jgi:hypothetical protein
MSAIKLTWRPVIGLPDFSGPEDWAFESDYRGLRVACGYNDGGPVAWVGHPTEDWWIDSVACDGSFESGAARAAALADETLSRPEWLAAIGVKNVEVEQ